MTAANVDSDSCISGANAPDLVILVHGTFASADREDGGRWWQRGSETWNWLADHLPSGAALPDDSMRLFTWDGRNSQISRHHAGNRLLALLLELERQGRRYHLVGHSHGGSVIWEALVSAEITRRYRTVYPELRRALNDETVRLGDEPLVAARADEYAPWIMKYKTRSIPRPAEYAAIHKEVRLTGLRSWATVGTPFLRYLPVRRFLVTGWRSRNLSLHERKTRRTLLLDLLLILTVTAPVYLILAMVVASFLQADWPRTFWDSAVGNALALPYAAWWVVAFRTMAAGNYANSLLARQRACHHAWERYSGRWLGLWSPTDEAINVLATSTRHDFNYEWLCQSPDRREAHTMPRLPIEAPLPRLAVPEPAAAAHLLPDAMLLSPARLAKPVLYLINRWLEPFWRRRIATTLVRTVQGSDLPAAVAAYASPWPVPLADARAYPGLPPEVIDRLDRRVAEHNATLGPLARERLLRAALHGLPELGQADPDPEALVHTAYLADPDVRRLLLLHLVGDGAADPWLSEHTAAVRARIDSVVTPDVDDNDPPAALSGSNGRYCRTS